MSLAWTTSEHDKPTGRGRSSSTRSAAATAAPRSVTAGRRRNDATGRHSVPPAAMTPDRSVQTARDARLVEPTRIGRGLPADLDYRGRSYLVEQRRGDPRVYGIIVTDRRAQNSRGVGMVTPGVRGATLPTTALRCCRPPHGVRQASVRGVPRACRPASLPRLWQEAHTLDHRHERPVRRGRVAMPGEGL